MLNGASPRAAAATPEGRELLEVLLDDYAYSFFETDDPAKPDVPALRMELGLPVNGPERVP